MKDSQFNLILAILWIISAQVHFLAQHVASGWFGITLSVIFIALAIIAKLNEPGEVDARDTTTNTTI